MDFTRIKGYIAHCWRVLLITKRPDRDEYKTIVKAAGLGIAIIGLIGFLLAIFNQLLFT